MPIFWSTLPPRWENKWKVDLGLKNLKRKRKRERKRERERKKDIKKRNHETIRNPSPYQCVME